MNSESLNWLTQQLFLNPTLVKPSLSHLDRTRELALNKFCRGTYPAVLATQQVVSLFKFLSLNLSHCPGSRAKCFDDFFLRALRSTFTSLILLSQATVCIVFSSAQPTSARKRGYTLFMARPVAQRSAGVHSAFVTTHCAEVACVRIVFSKTRCAEVRMCALRFCHDPVRRGSM